MVIDFKYSIGQKVFYEGETWEIVSQAFIRTRINDVVYYNLKNVKNPAQYRPNIWEHELKVLELVK